jgi:cyclic beta-1,2-glucan synthetase
MTAMTAREPVPAFFLAFVGAALVAAGLWTSLALQLWIGAAVLGAAGLGAWRFAATGRPGSPVQIIIDAIAFGIFAIARNNAIGFWQLPGPWKDVPLFNPAGAEIAYAVYLGGSLAAFLVGLRSLRVVESLGLIATPFLFNLIMTLAADWHMGELGSLLTPGVALSFQGQVFVGRAAILFIVAEAMLAAFATMRTGRPALDPKLHGLLIVVAALAAATPLLANFAQISGFSPVLGIFVGAIFASIAQAGLWSIVYVFTGVALDWIGGKAPSFVSVYAHWRIGLIKGAIYGGLFMFGLLTLAAPLRNPSFANFVKDNAVLLSPFIGALAFPLAATIVGSADGTPPFFGRLRAAYRDPRAYARGAVAGLGAAVALTSNLRDADGGTRFVWLFLVGALAYAGVDLSFDLARVLRGERRAVQTWRLYALGAALGGLVAGALGWYFDAPQIKVVTDKFWAYADINYTLTGRALGDFTTYPIFNKYGSIDLGQIVGGVRLFYTESLAGVINWSIAAPLFGVNFVLLNVLFDRSLRPIKGLVSGAGIEGLVAQTVRVMRWGLWMAPIINSFLRQQPEPSWFNQDGAIRTLVSIGADIGLPPVDFNNFSLTIFLGLLAYDWLRVLIWFDHMGLRVATLVNLTFIGGDRADEAAARYLGYAARTRVVPDGIRRFSTWAPLLIPFYIPRGPDWDHAWNGAEALRNNAAAPLPGPVNAMLIAYCCAGVAFAAAALIAGQRLREKTGAAAPALAGVPETLGDVPQDVSLTNGSVGLDLMRDGRGAVFVTGEERGGSPIDLTRRPLDPLQSRGMFFYLREGDGEPWSIGFEPARRAGAYRFEETGRNSVFIVNEIDGLEARMEAGPDGEGAVLSWRLSFSDKSGRARRFRLASFAEIAAHETGAYMRDLDFAGMHVETFFIRDLNAIFTRNRLLRSNRAGRHEMGFFAVRALSPGAKLVGYEDSRTRFLGEGSMTQPQGLDENRPRSLDDQGKLWTFDPAASLSLDIELAANGAAEVEFIAGRADNERAATDLIARRLNLTPIAEEELASRVYHTRMVEPNPPPASRWPFAFSEDGTTLRMTHRTPRPWAHVMANELGAGAVVSNDGEVYSFFGNAQQNGLTPYRFDSVTIPQPGQVVYLRNLDTNDADAVGFTPYQHRDATHDVVYEPGVATFRKTRGALATEYCVFVPPDYRGDMRLLSLRNLGQSPLRLRVTPFFDIALGEAPNATKDLIEVEEVESILLFENPRNDFQRGVAFTATSLAGATRETVRKRFFGGPGRNITSPVFVETGASDASQHDDGRRVAAFASEITLAPGEERKIAIVFGQAADRDGAIAAASKAKIEEVEAALAATRQSWREKLGHVHIKTNRPDFDRLVNTWLPYQAMASRLFGRIGPNQRGGAFGFRDQLQDVLPLVFIEPRLTRAQIVLHASQQFLEGDVLKWWHRAPDGRTGLGQRTRASDPHLWLPYVLTRYVAATGDRTVLDEKVAYLEGPAVPEHEDTWVIVPRASLEIGDVYEHCQRAIDYTLAHMGENGLPLLGAGDWNDGIDGLGRLGRGTSVWMGFFFYDVLARFAPIAEARGDAAFARKCENARTALRAALDVGWQGTHYALDFADSGEPLAMPNAMTTGWPAYSGAVDFARGVASIEGGLKGIERPDRILLTEKPFFEHSTPYPGRIADYPPGVRENGGQYSHGASWIIDGFVRLAEEARAAGDETQAARLIGRAFEIFEKISPLKKTDPDRLARYGLAPNQQPADIYDGYGHDGRGGWSWYTGSAARMASAAYAILGLKMEDGKVVVAPEVFEPKGELQVEELRAGGHVWKGPGVETSPGEKPFRRQAQS